MANKKILTPMVAAIGTTFVISLAASPLVNAAENPFSMNNLSRGFMVAAAEDEGRRCGTFCGGVTESGNPRGGEAKCANMCAEVKKCGTFCAGFNETGEPRVTAEGLGGEVAKCGNICAADPRLKE
ncbi:MAG: hypothetical protein L0Z68_06930 [Gammaproteobacteria bacterium]|nr:hypothetical protein [Gammaproteobacteria bacterium]